MTRETDSTTNIPTLESVDALEAVPGYTLIRVLGQSTIARAYECRAERGGQIVVVKVLLKEAAADRAITNRMLRESRVMAGIRAHPNIARVLDVGEAGPGPYTAVERLTGTDLRTALVQTGRLPVVEALAAVRDATKAVEAAATVGVTHRDIKPSNLFRQTDGTVKLLDFGFAAPLKSLGGPEGVYGTPAFLAPELIKGAVPDVRTDIYALGATLFQLVTARPLFEGTTPEVLAAHQKKPVPSIATMVPDAGIAVVDILYRLLHKDPARRPQSAAEVMKLLDDAVSRALRGTSSGPVPANPAPSEPQWPTMASAPPIFSVPTLPPSLLQPAPAPSPAAPSSAAAQRRAEFGAGGTTNAGVSSPFDAKSAELDVPYQAQPTGVMGTLKQMSVTEIIQMLEIGKKSARIDVQIAGDASLQGVVHVHDGQLVSCVAGADVGEAAVVTLCTKKDGFFRIHYEKEPCARNITRPTTFVLLEAMRQIDETSKHAPARKAPATPAAPTAAPQAPPHSGSPTPPKPTRTPAAALQLPPLPALAKPRQPAAPEGPAAVWPQPPPLQRAEATASGAGRPKPAPPGVGDGIDFGVQLTTVPGVPEGTNADLDDVTLREAALPRPALAAVLEQRFLPALRGFFGERLPALWARGDAAAAPLSPVLARVHPKLGEVSPLAVIAVAVGFVLAVIIGAFSVTGGPARGLGYDDGLKLLFRGHAAEVADNLAAVQERTPAQTLLWAHASAARGDDDRAVALYASAFPAATDALELGFLLSRLDASAPDDEIDLLALWPDPAVDELLAPLTLDVNGLRRANAVAVLVERGALGRVEVDQVALLDLLPREGTCGTRRPALFALAAAGKSKAALEAVDRIGRAQDACFRMDEIAAAYKAIKKRVGGP